MTINTKASFVSRTGMFEFLRLMYSPGGGEGRGVVFGSPCRLVSSWLFRKPGRGEGSPRERIAQTVAQYQLMLDRGVAVGEEEIIVELADALATNRGLVRRWLHTPVTYGGAGVPPLATSEMARMRDVAPDRPRRLRLQLARPMPRQQMGVDTRAYWRETIMAPFQSIRATLRLESDRQQGRILFLDDTISWQELTRPHRWTRPAWDDEAPVGSVLAAALDEDARDMAEKHLLNFPVFERLRHRHGLRAAVDWLRNGGALLQVSNYRNALLRSTLLDIFNMSLWYGSRVAQNHNVRQHGLVAAYEYAAVRNLGRWTWGS